MEKNVNKKNRVIIAVLAGVVILAAAITGLYASGLLGNVAQTDGTKVNLKEMAKDVQDEKTLRELLLADEKLDITVNKDITITETMLVNGAKKLSGSGVLIASFDMKPATPLLDVQKGMSLTMDKFVLDGNSIADGIRVQKKATLETNKSEIIYPGLYGITVSGKADLKDSVIENMSSIGLCVLDEGKVTVDGGNYAGSNKNIMYVAGGGKLTVAGEILVERSLKSCIYNVGELTVNNGIIRDTNLYCIENRAKITTKYTGSKENGRIEVCDANLGVYSNSTFFSDIADVYAHDVKTNSFLLSNNQGRGRIKNCISENADGNALSLRGESLIEDLTVKNPNQSGIYAREKSKVTLKNVTIDGSRQRGMNCEGTTMTGENVTIINSHTIGMNAITSNDTNAEERTPCTVTLSKVTMKNNDGNNVRLQEGANVTLNNSDLGISKRTNVLVQKGKVVLNDTKMRGIKDEDVHVIEISKDGVCELRGNKTDVTDADTGYTKRLVAVYGGKLSMYGGSIHGISGTKESGAGVHVANKGSFNMYGGKIYDCATLANGGAVNISTESFFTMSGGEIYKNEGVFGAGVRSSEDSVFVMKGGSIHDNTGVPNTGRGGGVYIQGTVKLSGGKIYNNVSTYGGGIHIVPFDSALQKGTKKHGTLQMSGGEIYDNTAFNNGGGVMVNDGASAEFTGGEMHGNSAGQRGNGVLVGGKGELVSVKGAFHMSGGNSVELAETNTILKVHGTSLNKHSNADPLPVKPNDNLLSGETVIQCDSVDAAVKLEKSIGSADREFTMSRINDTLVVNWSTADMDMTGADTAYVSNYQQLKQAVESNTGKRYIVLTANIAMEGTIKVPGGTTSYIKDDGTARTLARIDGNGKTFFNDRSGAGLYLVATQKGNLTLDASYSADVKESTLQNVLAVRGSTVVDGVNFVNHTNGKTADAANRFIEMANGTLTAKNSVFDGGKAATGTAILGAEGTIIAENCTFKNNRAHYGGGAIRVEAGATLNMKKCVFENNEAGSVAGAINVDGGKMTAEDCGFVDNRCETTGGAIRVTGNGSAILTTTNTADSYFTTNIAKQGGGGIYVNNGIFSVDGYTFDGNKASEAGQAGAVTIGQSVKAQITNSTFKNNVSNTSSGGAMVMAAKSTVGMDGCIFENNHATTSGGAMKVETNAQVDVRNTTFRGNTSDTDGGVINNDLGKTTFTDCIFENNEAARSGGAIYSTKSDAVLTIVQTATGTSRFEGNKANEGGAIYANAGTLDIPSGTTFTGNIATNQGGAIRISDRATISGVVISDNRSQGGSGGAMHVSGTAVVTMTDSSMTGNQSATNSGAIKLDKNGKLNLTNVTFTNNKAPNADVDGGVMNVDGGILTAVDCKFDGNQATRNGGAIYVTNNGSATFKTSGNGEAYFKNNKSNSGAAVYVNSGTLLMQNVKVDNNDPTGGNAAVAAVGGTLTIEDCVFENNNAKSAGGAVRPNGTAVKLTLNRNIFKNNTSAGSGGAIQGAGGATITGTGNVFEENHAPRGGAIYLTGTNTSCNLADSTFTENTATGTDGGAICVVNSGVTLALTGTNNRFEGNTAKTYGGAVSIEDIKTATVSNTTFEGNTAETYGGAIYWDKDKSLTLTDVTFKNNIAKNGSGGAFYAKGKVTGTWKNLTLEGNVATPTAAGSSVSGGGLYLSNASTDLTLENATVKNNKAVHGGGIYNKGILTLTGQGTFEGNRCGNPYGQSGNASNTDGQGAAIKCEGTLNVTNYLFKDNYSAKDGGAIYVNANTNIFTDCTFIGNKAGYFENTDGTVKKYGGGGGAVYLTTSAKGNFVTTDGFTSVFENNSTNSSNGGAIYVNGSDVSMTGNYQFTGNVAGTTTAAVGNDIAVNNGKKLLISNASFTDNDGTNVEVGLVDGGKAEISGVVKGVEFVYKTTTANKEGVRIGNAGLLEGSSVYIVPAKYDIGNQVLFGSDATKLAAATSYCHVKPEATLTLSAEGKIAERTDAVAMIGETPYNSLKAAIDAVATNGTATIKLLRDTEISANITTNNGKKITLANAEGVKVHIFRGTALGTNDLFTVASGSTFTIQGEASLNKEGIVIDGRTALEAAAQKTQAALSGKRLIATAGNCTLQNITVQYNRNTNDNGAVETTGGSLTIEDCVLANNSCTNAGGAVRPDAAVTVTLNRNIFKNNTSDGSGGAIQGTGGATITGTGNVFEENKAPRGGAIYLTGTNTSCTLTDSTFKKNTATGGNNSGDGGAICTVNSGVTLSLTNASFIGNTSNKDGGAIKLADCKTATLNGTGSFVGNKAKGGAGGAINVSGGSISISSYRFEGNTATADGGAIRSQRPITVENCSFLNNQAGLGGAGRGGALYITGGSAVLTLKGTADFTGNSAKTKGNAISFRSGGSWTVVTGANWTFGENQTVMNDQNANNGDVAVNLFN